MGCCGSKEASEARAERQTLGGGRSGGGADNYEERRQKMLEAAEARNKENEMRGIKNPKAAKKLKEEQSAPKRVEINSRKDEQMARDWLS